MTEKSTRTAKSYKRQDFDNEFALRREKADCIREHIKALEKSCGPIDKHFLNWMHNHIHELEKYPRPLSDEVWEGFLFHRRIYIIDFDELRLENLREKIVKARAAHLEACQELRDVKAQIKIYSRMEKEAEDRLAIIIMGQKLDDELEKEMAPEYLEIAKDAALAVFIKMCRLLVSGGKDERT